MVNSSGFFVVIITSIIYINYISLNTYQIFIIFVGFRLLFKEITLLLYNYMYDQKIHPEKY